jgi:hypothetical protein
MLKTKGTQLEGRSHYFHDPITYEFQNDSEAAKEVLYIPSGKVVQLYDVVKQTQSVTQGKEKVIEIKFFAVALCGAITENAESYYIEVDYKKKKDSKHKEESEHKEEPEPLI